MCFLFLTLPWYPQKTSKNGILWQRGKFGCCHGGRLPWRWKGWRDKHYISTTIGSMGPWWYCIWGGGPKIMLPQNGWFILENPLKWMIWGYHYFRKHPYVTTWMVVFLMNRCIGKYTSYSSHGSYAIYDGYIIFRIYHFDWKEGWL